MRELVKICERAEWFVIKLKEITEHINADSSGQTTEHTHRNANVLPEAEEAVGER